MTAEPAAPLPVFSGFPARTRFTRIPEGFFIKLLPQIDSLEEMKVLLYALWRLEKLEGSLRYLTLADFMGDTALVQSLGSPGLQFGLQRCLLRGTLLAALPVGEEEPYYFLNTPRGRAAVKAIAEGSFTPGPDHRQPVGLDLDKPNIFRLYEENIGPLTPLVAETLGEAERTYPAEWIEDAVRIAVQNNVRRWKYIEAILRSWQEGGRNDPDR